MEELQIQDAGCTDEGKAASCPALEAASQQLSAAQRHFHTATAYAKHMAASQHHRLSGAANISAASQHAVCVSHEEDPLQCYQASAVHATVPLHQTPSMAKAGDQVTAASRSETDTSVDALNEPATRYELGIRSRVSHEQAETIRQSKHGDVLDGTHTEASSSKLPSSDHECRHQRQSASKVPAKGRKKRTIHPGTEQAPAKVTGRAATGSPEHALGRQKKLKAEHSVSDRAHSLSAQVGRSFEKHAGHAGLGLQSGRVSQAAGRYRKPADSCSKGSVQSPVRLTLPQEPLSKSPSRLGRSPRRCGKPAVGSNQSPDRTMGHVESLRQSPIRHSRCLACQAGTGPEIQFPNRLEMSPDKTHRFPWKPGGCVHESTAIQVSMRQSHSPRGTGLAHGTSSHPTFVPLEEGLNETNAPYLGLSTGLSAAASQSAATAKQPDSSIATATDHAPTRDACHSANVAGLPQTMQTLQPTTARAAAVLNGPDLAASAAAQAQAVHEQIPCMLSVAAGWHQPEITQHSTSSLQACRNADASQQEHPTAGRGSSSRHGDAFMGPPSGSLQQLSRAADNFILASCHSDASSSSSESDAAVGAGTLHRSLTGLVQGPLGSQLPSMADIAHIFMQRQRAHLVLQVRPAATACTYPCFQCFSVLVYRLDHIEQGHLHHT